MVAAPLAVNCRYASRGGAASITLSFDTDTNPLNGFAGTLWTVHVRSTSRPTAAVVTVPTAATSPGAYFVAAAITDSRHHVRYAYSANPVSIG